MNILTFDIEEWFHILDNDSTKTESEWATYEYRIESNMDRILGLLSRENQKATFFVLGWVARKFPDILKQIDSEGYEIATHSDLHQLAYNQSKEEFRNDLEISIKSLEDIIGKKIKTYRAPGFSLTNNNTWVFEELINQGIEIDCSVFPAKRAHGGFEQYGLAEPGLINFNGLQIKEFPINLVQVLGNKIIFSGGGYFRLFPYWAIKKMMKQSKYVMTYFHPRDFDPNQPMIKDLPLTRKFKSYYGLSGAFNKLESLIKDFSFVDLNEANANVDWSNARVIKINP
ncbi:MAG: polysaccharide deacetylase [Crocinitomicaceae bacterium]|nr:polysaccharide deacetylase [Crocinitomicaceae bacterium]|tara:strand:- start:4801 stop:5655 length:855 start_codon:yes stop_codon:yes gene_type:complete